MRPTCRVGKAAAVLDVADYVLKDGKPVLITGTPGGSRHLGGDAGDRERNRLQDEHRRRGSRPAHPSSNGRPMTSAPSAVFPDVLAELRDKGHKVVDTLGQTSANSIAVGPMARSARPIRDRGAVGGGAEKPLGIGKKSG